VPDQLIAPVIPPSAHSARGGPGRAGGGRPLPLASPPSVPLDAVYGMSRVDASGRVADQVITDVLNWRPGDRLTLTACAGVVVARRDPRRHGYRAGPVLCRDPGRAIAAGPDGPVPGGPDGDGPGPAASADLRRVRPGKHAWSWSRAW